MIDYLHLPTALLHEVGTNKALILAYFWASISGKMANHQEPVCWNTYDQIADATAISTSTVKRGVQELKDEYIEVTNPEGLDRTNHYSLTDKGLSFFRPIRSRKPSPSGQGNPTNRVNETPCSIDTNTHTNILTNNITTGAFLEKTPSSAIFDQENNNSSRKAKKADTPPSSARPPRVAEKWAKNKSLEENTLVAPKEWVGHNPPTVQAVYEYMANRSKDNSKSRDESRKFCEYYGEGKPTSNATWCQSDGRWLINWHKAASNWLARNFNNPPKNARTSVADLF